jgi:hypothetical protein
MPTHDYTISNGTGAAVRSDLNNALAAIVSNNSNSSEPATMYAYQWWADTSNAVMKIRNSANDGWIELFQLDGTITLEDGSASTPALAFRDDLNTGIFSSAADTFNVATAGVERMELGATTVFNEDGADVDFRIEGDTQENLFYVDAGNERIGINTSSPSKTFEMSGAGEPQFCIRSDRTGGTENMGSLFFRSQSTDIARIQVQVDGTIKFKNTSNLDQALTIDTNHNVVAGITAQESDSVTLMADGEVTASGFYFANNQGSAMNADGFRRITTNTVVIDTNSGEKVRVNANGRVGIGATDASTAQLVVYRQTVNSSNPIIEARSNHDTTNSVKFSIDGDGEGFFSDRVGFGNTTPNARVTISESTTLTGGDINVSADALVIDNSGGNTGLTFKTPNTATSRIAFGDPEDNNVGQIRYDHDNDAMIFDVNVNPRMTIDSNGNIGAPSGTNIFNASDERLKKNIVSLDKGLTSINSLRPVSFNWIDGFCDEEKQTLYGFIAQEVKTVDNNLIQLFSKDTLTVGDKKIDNALTVNEKLIIPMLVKAVQELSVKVAALEAA